MTRHDARTREQAVDYPVFSLFTGDRRHVAAEVVRRLGAAQILVINLARRCIRRASMENMLQCVDTSATQVEFVTATDGKQGMPDPTDGPLGPYKKMRVHERESYVAACYLSWVRALRRGIAIGRFPLLILEDDVLLCEPNFGHWQRPSLPMPEDAELVVLANGGRPPAAAPGGWTAPTAHYAPGSFPWGNAAILLPTAAGAVRLVDFLERRWREYGITHVDWAMQRDFAALGGRVYHASPPLVGWVASRSDIIGTVRSASRPLRMMAPMPLPGLALSQRLGARERTGARERSLELALGNRPESTRELHARLGVR